MLKKARVLLIDDHAFLRECLGALIDQQADLEVCGEAGDIAEGLRLVEERKPDVAVLDVSIKGGSGLDLIGTIKAVHADIRIIVLSVYDESLCAERALQAGAHGYIMKTEATKSILQGIRCVFGGKSYFSNKVTKTMAGRLLIGRAAAAKGSIIERLSERELQIFGLLGQGRTTRQIAEELHLSIKTVQSFCARMKQKLALTNGVELLREAIRWHDSQP